MAEKQEKNLSPDEAPPSAAVIPSRKKKGWRRKVLVATFFSACGLLVLFLLISFLFWIGIADRFIKEQFVASFDEMGIVFEADKFEVPLLPFRIELENANFRNKKTNQQLVLIKKGTLMLGIDDLFALRFSRTIRVRSTIIDGLDVWINFDKNGNSNFDGITATSQDGAIKFDYATSTLALNNGLIRFGDEVRRISARGNDVTLALEPKNIKAPEGDRKYQFKVSSRNSTFIYEKSKVDPIDIDATGIAHSNGAEISSLHVASPIGTSDISGTISSWKDFEYNLKVSSRIDLTKTTQTFPVGSPITGVGDFDGTISGKGEKYRVDGEITSNNLFAENVRLKALKVDAAIDGRSSVYEGHGKAIAELLTFEEFIVNYPQLSGSVRGNGTDFRWFGELQAIAARTPWGSISRLMIADASAEYQDKRLKTDFNTIRIGNFKSADTFVDSITVSGAKISSKNGETLANIPSAKANRVDVKGATLNDVNLNDIQVKNGNNNTDVNAKNVTVRQLETQDARLKDLRATNVRVQNRGNSTNAQADNVRSENVEAGAVNINGVDAAAVNVEINGDTTKVYSTRLKVAKISSNAAVLANLNIGGVRLSVRNGYIEGATDDFDAGDVDLVQNGKLNAVRVKKPIFVLEPSGRYRASMDMSIGGGLLGKVPLGEARAGVVATDQGVTLNEISASVFDGKLEGNAQIASNNSTKSSINATFADLNASQLLALAGGQMFPVEGKANGKANLSFYGTNIKQADGDVNADIVATAGNDDQGLIPLTGKIDLNAKNGLFSIREGILNTPKSALVATGKFDLSGNKSDMGLRLSSADASEIDHLFRVFDVSPETTVQLDNYKTEFAGNFLFDGRVTGNLSNPYVSGSAYLQSLLVSGNNLGSIGGNISVTPENIAFSEGLLTETDGGTLAFNVNSPRFGDNNMSVDAKLTNVDLGSILTALALDSIPESIREIKADTTGAVNLTGLPNQMQGEATLTAKNGSVKGESFENLNTHVIFDGTRINLDKLFAQFGKGTFNANGIFDTTSRLFDFQANSDEVPIERLIAFLPVKESAPKIEGDINFEGKATGNANNPATFDINFSGVGNNVAINGSAFGNISFEGKTVNQILTAKMTSRLSGKIQLINGTVNFGETGMPLHAEATLNQSPLEPFIAIVRPPSRDNSIDISGTASGKILLDGNLTKPNDSGNNVFTSEFLRGIAHFTKFSLKVNETPLSATDVNVTFDTNHATINNARFTGGGSDLAVNGTVAFANNYSNNLSLNGKLNLRILDAISKNMFFSGYADLAVRLTGANADARLNGMAGVESASATTFVGSERITFERLNGNIIFTSNQVQIDRLTGFLGGGRIVASGGALLRNLKLTGYRMEVRGDDVTARLPKDFITTGDADVQINGRLIEPNDPVKQATMETLVSGQFIAKRSTYGKDIDIADLISGRRDISLSQSSGGGSSLIGVPKLDIRVLGRNSVRINNNIADLTASADLRVTGDIEYPQLTGRITANTGTIFFRDDRYDIQRGVLVFPPNSDSLMPNINLLAVTEKSGYQIFVSLSGPLSDSEALNVNLRSNPSLPQADVVSLITTGNLANTGSGIPTYAQGVNTAAEILTDQIINKPIQKATDKLFGINRFQLDPIISGVRKNPTARLTVGRQINRNLLVTYSTNLSEDQNQVLALEYRVSNRLSFLAQYEQRSLTNVTRNRNNFSFEIRLKKRF
ncbi:MAG: translocation/assembly module TamB domain-containing protein [Pyrinomonadaceae bacterium]